MERDEATRHQIPAPQWADEQLKRRRQRNLALAWILGGFVLLFFVVTIAKLGGNVANRPF